MPEVGELIASGRAADVYAYGDKHVLRRYRHDHDNTYEMDVMRHVADHDYPVPEVVEARGRDLVMERLDGTTMLSDLQKHPWRILRYADTCGRLIQQLHEIPPAHWMERRHVEGDRVVHLDLHPDNIMVTSRGPVVIDWSNAGLGDPDAEVADLWLVLRTAQAPASGFQRLIVGAGRGLLTKRILGHFDRDAVRRKLHVAVELRSRDRNMSEAEKSRMQELLRREAP